MQPLVVAAVVPAAARGDDAMHLAFLKCCCHLGAATVVAKQHMTALLLLLLSRGSGDKGCRSVPDHATRPSDLAAPVNTAASIRNSEHPQMPSWLYAVRCSPAHLQSISMPRVGRQSKRLRETYHLCRSFATRVHDVHTDWLFATNPHAEPPEQSQHSHSTTPTRKFN